eukprot:PhF_6_TR37685/c0_g1_i2/m.56089
MPLFYDLADENGLMLLPGLSCWNAWQHWSYWGPEQYSIAKSSVQSQLERLAIHPSVIAFVYVSDELTPHKVEEMYLEVGKEVEWQNPTLSSASASPSPLTGPFGVKMSGPYSWVPPSYWLLDENGDEKWGFLTEGEARCQQMRLLMGYESHRAMFESYSRNKHVRAHLCRAMDAQQCVSQSYVAFV